MISAFAGNKYRLSVVVASQNAAGSVGDCLRSINDQCNNGNVEVIVVDNSTDGSADIVRSGFPSVKLTKAGRDKLIPELWGLGIRESTGEYIALTTSHFVPSETWVARILAAHEKPFVGIGGAIENSADAGPVSWAVYFCRYSPYMLPFSEAEVEDFAADNASYKRIELERLNGDIGDGFWETFVHREMRRRGLPLAKSPEIVVYHRSSFSFFSFIGQRFSHGRQFGSARAVEMSAVRRLLFALVSPAIPFVYLYRISHRVVAKKRNISRYLMSLPILIVFLLSWAAGELSGYLLRSKR